MPRTVGKKTNSHGDPKVCVAYLRVSTDEQHLGPEAQRAAIGRWAAAQGVRVAAEFVDAGVSGGAALDRRPGLAAAIEAVKAHGAGVLVVAKRDRLARDVAIAAVVEVEAGRAGARVVSAAGEGDGDDPTALLMRRMVDAFAEFERAIIRARTKAALDVKRARGEALGNVPFGSRRDGRALAPSEAEAATVAAAQALRSTGLSQRAVARRLAELGHVGRTGRPLGQTQVARILRRSRLRPRRRIRPDISCRLGYRRIHWGPMSRTRPHAYCLRLSELEAQRLEAVQRHYQGQIDRLGQVQTVSTADVFRTLLRAEAERLGLEPEAPAKTRPARRPKASAA